MMNKLKNLYLLAICAVLIGGAQAANVSAQRGNGSDKVLVAGKSGISQSEINKLIEFYEWAFETGFSSDERARYQAFVVQGFREDAAEGRKNADSLLSAYDKVRAKDVETQAKLRGMFNEGFVKDLRVANDEGSRMLLDIYERGQNAVNGSIREVLPSEEDMRDAEKPPSNGVGSSNLVGAWFRSDGTGGATDGTGKTRYNSGTDTTFEFFADGRMRVTIKQETLSITQCQINETTKLPGTYSVSGDRLTMNFSAGTVVGTNSCQSSGNFKKTLTASTMTKTFVVKNLESVFRPDAPRILCLDGSADNACFEKTIR